MTPKNDRLNQLGTVDLYPVTCEPLSNGRSDFDVLNAIIAAGCRMIQLRDKVSSKRRILEKAREFRRITAAHGVLLIINDHIDIAMAVGADGVHLGQDDFPVPEARQLIPEMIIGQSCHSIEDARRAEAEGADYFNIGPIFPTGTKENAPKFLGIEAIATISAASNLPFSVMGGIKKAHIPDLIAAGAQMIALVTAVTQAEDMVAAARELRQLITE